MKRSSLFVLFSEITVWIAFPSGISLLQQRAVSICLQNPCCNPFLSIQVMTFSSCNLYVPNPSRGMTCLFGNVQKGGPFFFFFYSSSAIQINYITQLIHFQLIHIQLISSCCIIMRYAVFVYGFAFVLLSTALHQLIAAAALPYAVYVVIGSFISLCQVVIAVAWAGHFANVKSSLLIRYGLWRLIFAGKTALLAWTIEIIIILLFQLIWMYKYKSSLDLYEIRMRLKPYGQAVCICSTITITFISLLVVDICNWNGDGCIWIIGGCVIVLSYLQIRGGGRRRNRLMRYAGWNCYSFVLIAYMGLDRGSAIGVLLMWMIVIRMIHPSPTPTDKLIKLGLVSIMNDGELPYQLSNGLWLESICGGWVVYMDEISVSCSRGMLFLSICNCMYALFSPPSVGWLIISTVVSWKYGRWTTLSLINVHLLIYTHIVIILSRNPDCTTYECISKQQYVQNHCNIISKILCISISMLPLINCMIRYCKLFMPLSSLSSLSSLSKLQQIIRYVYPPIILLIVLEWECIRVEYIWMLLVAISIDIGQ